MYGLVTLLRPGAADGSWQSTGGLTPLPFALQVTFMYLEQRGRCDLSLH
jgi:hypothetical protein